MAAQTLAEHVEARIERGIDEGRLQALEGTLQRVNYPRKELTVVAHGQIWQFALDKDAQLWFDDQKTILRCFHPLDQVRIIFADHRPRLLVKAIYSWERPSA